MSEVPKVELRRASTDWVMTFDATTNLWKGKAPAQAAIRHAAGTEVVGTAKSIPANDAFDWYGIMRLDAADFLVGGASANTSLTFQAEGEIAIS